MNKKIIAAFKTHFDYGYTDTAENVLAHYCTDVLYSAIDVCRRSQQLGKNLEYKWTLPSYLLMKMYERSEGDERNSFSELIERSQIVCHALPFTMHTPLLDEEMLRRIFVFTEEYCRTFKKPFPISAKMTDVPGHTSSIIAPLVGRGVKFLHLGKNPASAKPDVPILFWWEDLKGNRILTMYSGDYGTSILPPEDWKYPVWLAMLQTGDNVGVQSIEFIRECAGKVSEDCEFQTGTLDDFANEIFKCDLSDLPVVRGELGDTWIHGAGTYPAAMSVFKRSLRKFADLQNTAKQKDIDIEAYADKFYKLALVFAEHTFGLNMLKYIGKNRKYDKESLRVARESEPNYKLVEKSWREQENYAAQMREILEQAEKSVSISAKREEKYLPFEIRKKGSSLYLTLPDKRKVALSYEYIVFGQEDIHRFLKEYLERFWEWSLSDFGRYEYPSDKRKTYVSRVGDIRKTETGYTVTFLQEDESCAVYGNFYSAEIALSLTEAGLHIRFVGKGKDSTPMVEAGNFRISLCGNGKSFKVRQGDQLVDVKKDIVRGANHGLWAVNETAEIDGTVLHTYDAPLVSFGENGICKYRDKPSRSPKADFVVNLFNNHWGTNFPQWIEGDFEFEFLLSVKH